MSALPASTLPGSAPIHLMRFRKLKSLIVLALLLVTVAVEAQQPQTNPAASDNANLDSLRKSGVEALYNLDYEKAQKDFKEIVQLYPNHPAGPQLLAARVWI